MGSTPVVLAKKDASDALRSQFKQEVDPANELYCEGGHELQTVAPLVVLK